LKFVYLASNYTRYSQNITNINFENFFDMWKYTTKYFKWENLNKFTLSQILLQTHTIPNFTWSTRYWTVGIYLDAILMRYYIQRYSATHAIYISWGLTLNKYRYFSKLYKIQFWTSLQLTVFNNSVFLKSYLNLNFICSVKEISGFLNAINWLNTYL
jgi:hypothetical protein